MKAHGLPLTIDSRNMLDQNNLKLIFYFSLLECKILFFPVSKSSFLPVSPCEIELRGVIFFETCSSEVFLISKYILSISFGPAHANIPNAEIIAAISFIIIQSSIPKFESKRLCQLEDKLDFFRV